MIDAIKRVSEPFQAEHAFVNTEGYTTYYRQIREIATQLKAKGEVSATLKRPQFKEFLDINKELTRAVYKDRSVSKHAILRPYLDNLYERITRKAIASSKVKEAGKNATVINAFKATNDESETRSIQESVATFEAPKLSAFDPRSSQKNRSIKTTSSRSRTKDKPDYLETPGGAKSFDFSRGGPRKQQIKVTPVRESSKSPDPSDGSSSHKLSNMTTRSILKSPESSSRRNRNVNFNINLSKNTVKTFAPDGKVIFDWEIMPPNDSSIDYEHDRVLANHKFKKVAEIDESNPKSLTKSSKSPSMQSLSSMDSNLKQDTKMEKLPLPFLDITSNTLPDLSESSKPATTKEQVSVTKLTKFVSDSKSTQKKKKAIIDNRCTFEEWVTYRKQFETLKASLVEGIVVIKYGRKNFFKADQRRLFFIDNYTQFTWSKINAIDYDKIFKVADIQEIKKGKWTENIKRFGKANSELCFSIFMKDRTIDLEFKNQKEFNMLYYGFKFFMRMSTRFQRNMHLYECLSDEIPLEIFEEVRAEFDALSGSVTQRSLK